LYKRNIDARSRYRCCRAKAIIITYSDCVSVVLGIQHAMRMRNIILSAVDCLAVPYLCTLSHKRHDFRREKYNTEHKMCVLIFSTISVRNVSHSKKNYSAGCYRKCTQDFV